MVGGTDFWETQFNRATLAMRQPGSAFKPFVYATALEGGMSADDEILDEPVAYPGASPGATWSPKNYDNQYHGMVPLKTAIALSLNTATVRLASDIGIAKIIGLAKRCGIKSTLQPYLPIALGASDVTLLDLTAAYGTLAIGRKTEPMTYARILNRDGIQVEAIHPSSEEVLAQDTLDKMKENCSCSNRNRDRHKSKRDKRMASTARQAPQIISPMHGLSVSTTISLSGCGWDGTTTNL